MSPWCLHSHVLSRKAGCARAVSSKSVLAVGCARMEETGLAAFRLRPRLERRLPAGGDERATLSTRRGYHGAQSLRGSRTARLAPGPGSGFAGGATAAPRSAMTVASRLRARHGACAGRAAPEPAPGARSNVMLKSKHSQSVARRSLPRALGRTATQVRSRKLRSGGSFPRESSESVFVGMSYSAVPSRISSLRRCGWWWRWIGAQHRQRVMADASRDRDLRRLGCEVLRIEAQVVMRDLPRAVGLVREAVEGLQR